MSVCKFHTMNYKNPNDMLALATLLLVQADNEGNRSEEDVVSSTMARNAIMAEVIMMKSYLQNEGVITDEPCRLELCHELCKNIDDRFSNLDVEMLHIAQNHTNSTTDVDLPTARKLVALAKHTASIIFSQSPSH